MVTITKTFLYWDNETRSFRNYRGQIGVVKYSNLKGSMVTFDDGVEIFIPKDACEKIN